MSAEQENQPAEEQQGVDRRNFLKLGLAGIGVAAAAVTGVTINKRLEGLPHDKFPLPLNDDFERIDQRNQINTFCDSKALSERHPERSRLFTERLKKEDPNGYREFDFYKEKRGFMKGPYRDTPGYGHLERALAIGGFSSPNTLLGWGKAGMDVVNGGVVSWRQHQLSENRYEFETPQDANRIIKSAAKVYGALRCGITRRDKRGDYDPLYDVETERELSWENDFPFEPKSVIVIMVEMDYEAMATAPSWITDATTGEGYGSAVNVAGQLAYFLRNLGYRAVASLNDLGINPAYAAAAGLGEAARNGQLITPKYGPRVRIAKVYTELDFGECDKARTFGVASFCKHCKRCAEACPSQAITHGEPSWGPTWSENPDDHWAASKGIFKFHNDSQRCFKFWTDNDGGCASCICSCPYNKPDFWHHRLVDASNVIAPGAVHTIMREMDILFGYGTVSDPDRVRRFWKSGDDI
jgi:reductive dehalogenase